MRRPILFALLAFGCGTLWLAAPVDLAAGAPAPAEDVLISAAIRVFQRVMDARSPAIPFDVMKGAQAIAVIPGARNEGTYNAGTGVVSALGGQQWSAPAIITYDGRIVPALDVHTVDLILIAVSARGRLYLSDDESSFVVSGVIAPGPLVRDVQITPNADIVAYVQFGGYFAGVTLDEWSICTAPFANERLYGTPLKTSTLLSGGFRLPAPAQAWRNALAGYAKETS